MGAARQPGGSAPLPGGDALPEKALARGLRQFVLKAARGTVYWLGLFILAFFAVNSLLFSSVYPPDYIEQILYRTDYLFITLPAAAMVMLAVGLLLKYKVYEKLSPKWMEAILLVWVAGLGVAWVLLVRGVPVDDMGAIQGHVREMMAGEYYSLREGWYLGIYTNQLGYAFFSEMLYRLTGTQDVLLLQLVNVPLVVLAYHAMVSITRRIFDGDSKIVFITMLMLAAFIQPVIYTTFVYGTQLGLTLGLFAVDGCLKYLRAPGPWPLVRTVLCTWLAVVAKQNYLVFAVGIMLVLLVGLVQRPRALTGAGIGLLVVVCLFANKPVEWYYEAASGEDIGPGMPRVLHLAMGLQESPHAPGWYNEYNMSTYVLSDYNNEAAAAKAKEDIRASLQGFAKDPAHAALFFYRKEVSQWNDPTFGSLYTNVRMRDPEKPLSPLLENIYYGPANRALYYGMDIYHFLVMGGALAGLLLWRKRLALWQLLPLVVVIGGFLFHTLWEAKTLYTWPYFMLLVPYAAAGLAGLAQWGRARLAGWKGRAAIKTQEASTGKSPQDLVS